MSRTAVAAILAGTFAALLVLGRPLWAGPLAGAGALAAASLAAPLRHRARLHLVATLALAMAVILFFATRAQTGA